MGIGAAVMLLATETGLQWTLAQAVRFSDGQFTFTQARGTLWGPLSIEQLRYATSAFTLTVNEASLNWRPQSLLAGRVHIARLAAREIQIEWRGAKEKPPQAQTPFEIPIAFVIDALDVSRLQFRVAKQTYAAQNVKLQASGDDTGLRATLQANDAALVLKTTLTAAPQTWDAELVLKQFDLAAVGTLPPSSLNATLKINGEFGRNTDIALTLRESTINAQPAQGAALVRLAPGRVAAVQIDTRIANNRIEANGAFGLADDILRWRIEAPTLARLGTGFAGAVRGQGELRGTFAQPALRFNIDARGVKILDVHRVASIVGSGDISGETDARVNARARVRDYRAGDFVLDSAELELSGRRDRHDIAVRARNRTFDLDLAARGAWLAGKWEGSVLRVHNGGRYGLDLRAPATLQVSAQTLVLRKARLGVAAGEVEIEELQRVDAAWRTRGRAQGITFSALAAWLPQRLPASANLTLGASWDLRADTRINGDLKLWRERGDIRVNTYPAHKLGLADLVLEAHAQDDNVTAKLHVRGDKIGTLAATAQARLTRTGAVWGLAGNTPLTMDADIDVPSLAWLALFTQDKADLDGAIRARIGVRGSLAQPQWSGSIRGTGLALKIPELGLNWTDGVLEAALHGDRLALQQLRLNGGTGAINANGGWGMHDNTVDIDVHAEKIEVVNLPQRDIVASGRSKISLREQRLHIAGDFKVDRGRIELPKTDAPTISDDVVIVGQEGAAQKKPLPFAPQLDLNVDLGEQFYLEGQGLDVQLGGSVRVRATARGLPLANGVIRVTRGTYAAYGQRLEVERGVLTFSGPIDNPGLNILALRKNQEVHAGVSITGTAQLPIIKLVSIPEVADGDKLSWLVLGKGLDKSSGAEIDVLNSAAASLLARGESVALQTKIAQRFGLDEFRFSGGGGLESAVVTVGKRISSLVYLTYEQGITGTTNLLKVRYTLTPRWSLQTQTGTKDSAVDLFYRFAFD